MNIKSIISLTLALMLICAPALAETTDAPAVAVQTGFSAKGAVIRPNPITLTAPVGGQVQDFAWVSGDTADVDDIALTLRPNEVRAAADGVITGLRAHVGDKAEDVQAQYGALCYIERQDIWHIDASTTNAYDDPENRDVRIGQTVRMQQGTGDDKIKGEGIVISMDGKEFVVEMPQDDFELEKSIKLYLASSKDNANRDQVGSGKIMRAPALPAIGEGIIADVLVKEGDTVSKGQPLFVLDDPHARHAEGDKETGAVPFGTHAIINEVLVNPGQFVVQGQALMTLYPIDNLEASLEVDELDIARVRVGDAIRIKVDAFDQDRSATVTAIRPLGMTVLDTTKFDVRIRFEHAGDLMIGMHVTGYWN